MRLIDADAFERRCMFDSNIEDMQDVIYALRDFPTGCDIEGIRAEINKALSAETISDDNHQISDVGIGLEMALSIIDRHIKEYTK